LNPTTLTITGSGTFSGPINGIGNITAAGSTLTLSGSSGYSGSTSVTAGTLTLDYNGSSQSSSLTSAPGTNLNINQPLATTATLTANGNINLGKNASNRHSFPLRFGAEHRQRRHPHGRAPSAPANRTVLATAPPNFTTGGTLNLTGNDLIVHSGNPTTVFDEIQSGLAGSGGITSSSASSDTTLGMELNNNGSNAVITSTFDGQPVIDTDVLVKYTYFGDANLSGTVNAMDYEAIDNGFNSQTGPIP
jgi:autotransporter-associated beta strand protein